MNHTAGLWRHEVLPFVGSFIALVAAALALDALLHVLNAVWVGRFIGIPGTLIILGSFAYSLRKRRLIAWGRPPTLLKRHEFMAWFGSLLVLVHGGIHFHALLPWLATGAMLVNVASGLTGKFLVDRSRRRLQQALQLLGEQGVAEAEVHERLYWDSLTFDVVKQWRVVHLPMAFAFAVLALAHVIAVFVFWEWK